MKLLKLHESKLFENTDLELNKFYKYNPKLQSYLNGFVVTRWDGFYRKTVEGNLYAVVMEMSGIRINSILYYENAIGDTGIIEKNFSTSDFDYAYDLMDNIFHDIDDKRLDKGINEAKMALGGIHIYESKKSKKSKKVNEKANKYNEFTGGYEELTVKDYKIILDSSDSDSAMEISRKILYPEMSQKDYDSIFTHPTSEFVHIENLGDRELYEAGKGTIKDLIIACIEEDRMSDSVKKNIIEGLNSDYSEALQKHKGILMSVLVKNYYGTLASTQVCKKSELMDEIISGSIRMESVIGYDDDLAGISPKAFKKLIDSDVVNFDELLSNSASSGSLILSESKEYVALFS